MRNDSSYLECSPAWCAASDDFESFRERSTSMTFEPGVGLPGRAWSTGRPIWVKDLRSEDLPRGPFALEVGIVAGIAVPVLAGREVVYRLLSVRAVFPKAVGGPNPQMARDEGPDRQTAGD